MKFNFLGHTGRKYSITIFGAVFSTLALFTGLCNFVAWAGFFSILLGQYGIMNHQAKKLDNES